MALRSGLGWVAADDGLLVRDINGDGIINNGGELFGDQTLLKNGQKSAGGFQALADLDSTAMGRLMQTMWLSLRSKSGKTLMVTAIQRQMS